MEDVAVRVTGIAELNNAFKKIDSTLPGEMKQGFLGLADMVVQTARRDVPGSGRARGSIKARASTRGASIAFGGQVAPHFPWLDFGGSTGRGHITGRAWSGAIKRDWKGSPVGCGRYVYPAIKHHNEDIKTETDKIVERVARKAGFDTDD